MRRLLLLSLLLLAACGDPASRRVAFGDSVTWGFGGRPGGWVTLLSQGLDEPIANYGVPTELARDGRRRFGSPAGPLSLSPLVEQVLLLHGGNDLASVFLEDPCAKKCEPREREEQIDAIVENVAAIADEAHHYDLEVVLGTYWKVSPAACAASDMKLSALETERANRFIAAYDDKLLAMAHQHRLPVIRLDEIGLESDASNFYDCIHPDHDGYRKVAAAWEAGLRALRHPPAVLDPAAAPALD